MDNLLVSMGYFDSRTKSKQAIERGEVLLNGRVITKASYEINEINKDAEDFNIEWIRECDFVSLGGFKLQKALRDFSFDVKDLICADVGASTGGFTDCLIKNGAKKVYSIDLNEGLLHNSLKINDKVKTVIKNAKHLERGDFNGDEIDLIVCDLSFISATHVIPIFYNIIDDGKFIILLVKPQFEMDGRRNFKNGIIKDNKLRKTACEKVINCAKENGLTPIKITTAPKNDNKNLEYLILLKKGESEIIDLNILNL